MKNLLFLLPSLLIMGCQSNPIGNQKVINDSSHSSVDALVQSKFNGIEVNMSNIYRLSDAKSRSISAENFSGAKGMGGMATKGTGEWDSRLLGRGWKVSPSVDIPPHTMFTIAEIDGPGSIQYIWMTAAGNYRNSILRFYWDDETSPSVEVPYGDFFCVGWGGFPTLQSLAVCVNPASGFNCYWPMPFRKKCRITMENVDDDKLTLYYQVDYILTQVQSDAAYFHTQFRRVNKLPYKTDYVLVDSIKGRGQYVGTYMAIEVKDDGWWGEGEFKFFMDDDMEFPTICGTGGEDYFCGAWGFGPKKLNTEYCSPYAGLPQCINGDGFLRIGLYRWHITDPIRFEENLKVTMQDLGWNGEEGLLIRQDDISSAVFWYQTEPHNVFPELPDKGALKIN